jgi:putative transposase
VLKERHARRLHDLIPRLCDERGIVLVEVAAGPDHVHVLFGLKPAQSVATAVREIKGRAGLELRAEFPELRVWLGGNLLWEERYAVETVSAARLPRIQEKLRSIHDWNEPLAHAS